MKKLLNVVMTGAVLFAALLLLMTAGARAQSKNGDSAHGNNGAPSISHGNSGHTNQGLVSQTNLIANEIGASEYSFANVGGVLLDGLLLLRSGDGAGILLPGDPLTAGIYWGTRLGVVYATETCSDVELGGNAVIGIGYDLAGSVTCKDGYYACCYCREVDGEQCAIGRCRKEGDDDGYVYDCLFGGPGVDKCEITTEDDCQTQWN